MLLVQGRELVLERGSFSAEELSQLKLVCFSVLDFYQGYVYVIYEVKLLQDRQKAKDLNGIDNV